MYIVHVYLQYMYIYSTCTPRTMYMYNYPVSMRSVQGSGDSSPHLPPLNGHCYETQY